MQAQLGSISSGTLREEDLIPCFLGELESLDKEAADKIRADFPKYEDADDEDSDFWIDESAFMLEELINALNDYAPPYCYFGSHPGDGADFGFWVSDSIGGLVSRLRAW